MFVPRYKLAITREQNITLTKGSLQKKNSKKSDIVTKGRYVGNQKPHFILGKQAERLKSRKRRAKVDRLDG